MNLKAESTRSLTSLEAVEGPWNCYQDGSVSYKTHPHGEPEGAEIVRLETKSGSRGSTTVKLTQIAKFSLVLAHNTTQVPQP